MSDGVRVLLSGCASVFVGMGVLYLTIRCTAFVVARLAPEVTENES